MKKNKIWTYVIYAYLLLPIMIFVLGWLKWFWAIPAAVGIGYAYICGVKDDNTDYQDVFQKDTVFKLLLAFGLILFWVYLSGIGGLCFQNTDHNYRTAVFRTLVECEWPVISADASRGMTYYIGFWLPAAVVGKMFGFDAGYSFQVIWATLGVFITYILLCVWRKKVEVWPLIVMVLFSGLDYVGWWLLNPSTGEFPAMLHLEWWATDFQFSSMTTQLFWVFNQSVPAWVAIMFIMVNAENKNRKNMLLILSSIMLSSTFSFGGLLPFVAYFMLKDNKFSQADMKDIFSRQNVLGVLVIGIISFVYLIGNGSTEIITNDTIATAGYVSGLTALLSYILFYVLEFGVYSIVIHKNESKNPIHYIVIGVLLICPLIKVGGAHDFCMRTSIPALFILMLLVIQNLEKYRADKKIEFYALLLVFALGAVTSFNEIHRTVYETVQGVNKGQMVTYQEPSTERVLSRQNFSGSTNSFFFSYLAK